MPASEPRPSTVPPRPNAAPDRDEDEEQTTEALDLDLVVEDERWDAATLGPLIEAAARAAFAAASADPTAPCEIVVVLADDAVQADLNARFLGKTTSTNVLSFPAAPPPPGLPGPRPLGDIVLAYETVAREAWDEGKSLGGHTAHLVAHGVLHLLGFDHRDEAEATRMEALETRILAGIGIADPYAAAGAPTSA